MRVAAGKVAGGGFGKRGGRVEVRQLGDVAHDGPELARAEGVLAVLEQALLALRAGDLVDVLVDPLEGAEAGQQVGRGLVADPGHAGDVVGGVALQADQVGDRGVRDAEALRQPSRAYPGDAPVKIREVRYVARWTMYLGTDKDLRQLAA